MSEQGIKVSRKPSLLSGLVWQREGGRPIPGKGEIFAQVAQSGGAAPDNQTTREEERWRETPYLSVNFRRITNIRQSVTFETRSTLNEQHLIIMQP